MRRAAALLARSERPVLVLGSQAVLETGAVSELARAVEALSVPVYLAGGARGLLGPSHPLQLRHRRKEALREADLVISAVQGEHALEAAEAAAPLLKKGAHYLDLCTVTGRMSDEDRAPIETAGGHYIDIAVMGGFFKQGIKAPMLVAGEDVEDVVAWMNANGFEAKVLGRKPGSASSVKMIRSVLIKGVEALGVEAYVTAERQGILKEVMGCMGDVDQISFANFVAMLVQTHIVHAHRRWEEMGLVAQTLRETGVEPLMTEVIERSHRRTVDAQIAPADGKVPSLEEALKILSEKVVRGR